MRVFFAIVFVMMAFFGKAQNVLLHKKVKVDTTESIFGPNKKHFLQGYIAYGFLVSETENQTKFGETKNILGKSNTYFLGFRYKRKIAENYAFLSEVAYNSVRYHIKQTGVSSFHNYPTAIAQNYSKEKFTFNNISIMLGNRINFGKRGNTIGKYIDLGIFGNYSYSVKHSGTHTGNVLASNSAGGQQEVVTSKLVYINPLNYGVHIRLGIEKTAMFARYRLSDMFLSSYNVPELSRLSIGLERTLGN